MNLLRRHEAREQEQAGDAFVVSPGQEPLFPPIPRPPDASRGRRRWVVVAVAGFFLLLAGAAGVVLFLMSRGPGLGTYDDVLQDAVRIASATQSSANEVTGPVDRVRLRSTLALRRADLASLQNQAQGVPQLRYRTALIAALVDEDRYLGELSRLAKLSPAKATSDQVAVARELAARAEGSLANALALHRGESLAAARVALGVGVLSRELAEERRAWVALQRERAEAVRINRRRAATLGRLRSFTNEFDGIISRYSGARAELADWIDKVDTSGVSYDEAYQVLAQQADRRRQLRTELAALAAPAEFAPDKEAVLSAMDHAVDATEAASRGISEYQSDLNFQYARYDQTPGWQEFEASSAEISDSYEAAVFGYEQRKQTIFSRLKRKVELPTK